MKSRMNARGITLKYDGKIIGAYIDAGRHDSFACSPDRKSLKDITNKDWDNWVGDYIDYNSGLETKLPKMGPEDLAENSIYFVKARNYNITMIFLSLFSIYQQPGQGSGIQLGLLGLFSIPIAILLMVLSTLVVYNPFMGVKEMAKSREQIDIYTEANTRWKQFLCWQWHSLL